MILGKADNFFGPSCPVLFNSSILIVIQVETFFEPWLFESGGPFSTGSSEKGFGMMLLNDKKVSFHTVSTQ